MMAAISLLVAASALAAVVPPAQGQVPTPICPANAICVCRPTDMPDCAACKMFPQRCNPCLYNRHCDPCYIPTDPKCKPCDRPQPPASCAQCQTDPPAPECRNCTDYQVNPDCNPCTGRYEPSTNCPPECRQSSPPPAGCDNPCNGNDPPDGCGEHDCAPLPRCLDDPGFADRPSGAAAPSDQAALRSAAASAEPPAAALAVAWWADAGDAALPA